MYFAVIGICKPLDERIRVVVMVGDVVLRLVFNIRIVAFGLDISLGVLGHDMKSLDSKDGANCFKNWAMNFDVLLVNTKWWFP